MSRTIAKVLRRKNKEKNETNAKYWICKKEGRDIREWDQCQPSNMRSKCRGSGINKGRSPKETKTILTSLALSGLDDALSETPARKHRLHSGP